jgi:hypothetical protein
MRIRRSIIIPAILALSAAGSILAGSAVASAATQASGAHVAVTASSARPDVFYDG